MIQFDPGSFKDPAGRVFLHEGTICRTISTAARQHFDAALRSGLIPSLVADGLLLDTRLEPAGQLGLPSIEVGDHVLVQPRVPVVTYSYEWSFEMLRDAALVTLRIMDRALAAGYTLKDAPAFNVLFHGTQPRLVDVLSLEPHQDGQIWTGYGQFCRSFLFPLLLASYRDIDVRPILQGYLGEIPVQQAAKLFRLRDYARAGVLKDVVSQSLLDRSFSGFQTGVKASTASHVYPTALLVANVRRLTALVEGLRPPAESGEWSHYDTCHSYSGTDRATKAAFVQRTLADRPCRRVIDLGCNIGEYSDVALATGADVTALDLDAGAIDRLYRAHPRQSALTPVVATLLRPTPAMGWGLRERSSLLDRIQSDSFLALALIHHLRITGGVPLEAIVEQLLRIAPDGVIEWVDKQDAMVERMLSLRRDVYDDYTWESFQAIVSRSADFVAVQDTHGGRRRLCHVRSHRRPTPTPSAQAASVAVTA